MNRNAWVTWLIMIMTALSFTLFVIFRSKKNGLPSKDPSNENGIKSDIVIFFLKLNGFASKIIV